MQSDEELFQKAKKLHISGKIQNAQVIYLKLLEKNSESSSLLFLIGSTYIQLHNCMGMGHFVCTFRLRVGRYCLSLYSLQTQVSTQHMNLTFYS